MDFINFNENIEVLPLRIKAKKHQVSAFLFLPERQKKELHNFCVFTHGYTTSKHSIFSWGQRMAEDGWGSLIFNLPGHYLAEFEDIDSLDDFFSTSLALFESGFETLVDHAQKHFQVAIERVALGGHSLGALLSLMSLESDYWKKYHVEGVVVGLGLNSDVDVHLFDTAFFEKTMNIRRQLVSRSLDTKLMFPKIKALKKNLKATGQKITMITGLDDVVVGKEGTENLANSLKALNNQVKVIKPGKLSHHQPDMAASFIAKELRKNVWPAID